MRTTSSLLCILAILGIGCGDGSAAPRSDAGSIAPPADGGGDAQVPGDDAQVPGDDAGQPPPSAIEIERWGGRVRAPVLALSRTGRTLWMGTSLVEDPSDPADPIHGGLVRLDLDSGAMRIYDDELPVQVPIAGVVMDGERAIAVSPEGLIEIDGEEITLHPLARPDGEPLEPTRAVLDRPAEGDARLWVSTDLGLVLVDPDTLRVVTSNLPVGGPTGALAVDPKTRDVYVTQPEHQALVRVQYHPVDAGPILATWLRLGANGVTPGAPGDVVWSEELGAALLAVASYDPANGGVISWDGTQVRGLLREGQLSLAAHGEQVPFGAQTLAIDETDGVLIVGGQMRPGGIAGGTVGGGLVWLELESVGADPRVAGADVQNSQIGGDHVSALAYDPVTNRTFASLRLPCDEVHLANLGVDVISWAGTTLEVGTATLSGVRDLELRDGALWAALRDDSPSLACDGVGVQGGLFAVHDARGGVAPEMSASRGEGNLAVWRPARIAPNRIASRGDRRIVASFRDSLFVGAGDGVLVNPAVELGVNLRTHAAVWIDDDTFWLSGPAAHHPTDGIELADTGPRGAVRVDLDERGNVASWQRYVRGWREPEPSTTVGLPSANVTDVVVGDDGVTYLVSGTERMTSTVPYDRMVGEPFAIGGAIRRGGVTAVAADGTITVLDEGDDVPDARAAAIDSAGVLWVLDAERGLLRRDGDGFVAAPMPGIEVPEGSIPTDLYLEGDSMVATYSTGAAMRVGETTAWIDGVGWTWTALERAPGVLLIGADDGLVRVRVEGAIDPGEPAPVASDAPPFAPVPQPRL